MPSEAARAEAGGGQIETFVNMPLPSSVHTRMSAFANTANDIARSIVLPQDTPPVRIPVQTGMERTSLLPFQATGTLPFSTTITPNAYSLLCRHTISPLWISGSFASTASYISEQNAEDLDFTTLGASVSVPDSQLDGVAYWSSSPTLPSWMQTATSSVPNIPIGYDALTSKNYIWYPGSTAATAGPIMKVYLPSLTTGAYELSGCIKRWVAPGTEVVVSSFGPASYSLETLTVNFNTTLSGWYRFAELQFTVRTTQALTTPLWITTGWSTNGAGPPTSGTAAGLYPFNPPPDFGTTSNYPWVSSKCNSSAALATNISQVTEKQGTVLAARLMASDNPWTPNPSLLATRTPSEKYFGAFETGLYQFSSPGPESQTYQIAYRTLQGGNNFPSGPTIPTVAVYSPLYRLDDTGYYNVAIFTDNSTSPYPSIAFTVDWVVEFRSSSPLFPPAVSSTTLEAVHQAHLAVGMLNPFTENPKHALLRGIVSHAVDGIMRGVLGPAYGPARALVTSGISNLAQMVPGSQIVSNGSPKPRKKGVKVRTMVYVKQKAPAPKPKPKPPAKAAGKGKKQGGLAMYLAERKGRR